MAAIERCSLTKTRAARLPRSTPISRRRAALDFLRAFFDRGSDLSINQDEGMWRGDPALHRHTFPSGDSRTAVGSEHRIHDPIAVGVQRP